MADGVWETVHVLYAKADDSTGVVTCQVGDILTGEVIDPQAIMFAGGYGDLSLPAPPVGSSAAEAICLRTPVGNIIIGGRSVRSAKIGALIKMGEKAIFADGSQACALFKLDGSINLLTTHDNSDVGRNVSAYVSPTEGFGFEWPWSRFNLKQDGLHYQHLGGAFLDIGQLELTGPFEALASAVGGTPTYATLSAKLIRLEGTAISIGSASGVPDLVAKSTALLAVLDAIVAALHRLTLPSAILTASGGPGIADPSLVTIIEAAQAAMTTAHALVPSNSVTVT